MSFSAQRSLEHFREFSVKLRRFRKVIGNPRRRWDVFENRAIMASWLVVNLPGMSLFQITEDFFSDNTHHVRFPLNPSIMINNENLIRYPQIYSKKALNDDFVS